jgi:N utilization substance protein B
MALPPQKFRELVFLILYSTDFTEGEPEETTSMLMAELKVAKSHCLQAAVRSAEIRSRLSELDEKIREVSTEYSFERISSVEKAILRLGSFEMLFDPSIPPLVALAEAIRLTRKFGTPESAHFVNAILDRMYVASTKEPVSV